MTTGPGASGPASRPRTARADAEGGFALLLVLWTLGLLALLGTRIVASGRTEALLASNLDHAARLEALADGAARTALFHRLPGASLWPADGSWRRDPDRAAGAVLSVRILPLAGRFNPNLATPEQWLGLLGALGVPRDNAARLSQSLIAWRTPGVGDPSLLLYARGNRAWGPPGSPFESLGELGLVYGMTPELLALLQPHLSLATPLDPDPNLADPIIRRALSAAGDATGAAQQERNGAQAYQIETVAADGTARFGRRVIALVDPTDPDHPGRILEWDSF